MKCAALAIVLLAGACAPGCTDNTPSGPSATDLTGAWTGTSSYPNAPFSLSLTQTGGTLRGEYADGHDRSPSVTGSLSNRTMALVVDFGDAKLNLQGTVEGARTIEGVMFTSALGNRQYPFTMTR